MLFKLAIRNLIRNRKRSMITIIAIFFAVFLSSFLRSFQKGAWDNVVESSIDLFYGSLQVHKKGFWEDQNLDNTFANNEELRQNIDALPQIVSSTSRLESFALASVDDLTRGVMVIGVDPRSEDELTHIASKIQSGTYLRSEEDGVILAQGLADRLGLEVKDTLVLISQGYHGANAAGKYAVQGIFNYPIPELDKRLIYMPLTTAQDFYGAESMLSSIACKIEDDDKVDQVKEMLLGQLDPERYEVLDYRELMPELMQARQFDELGAYIILGILYCLIGFTLFGTILMMTKRRSYEFGVLLSIGMQRWRLFITVFLETLMLTIVGIALGLAVAIPLAHHFQLNPVDISNFGEDIAQVFENFGVAPVFGFSTSPSLYWHQALIVFILTILLSIYPLWRIFSMRPIEAMRE